MTVKELRKELKNCDQDAEIHLCVALAMWEGRKPAEVVHGSETFKIEEGDYYNPIMPKTGPIPFVTIYSNEVLYG